MRFIWGLIFLIAAGLRLFQLDLKPIHFDEGVNGWWIERIWEKGFFPYDPTNYHGPLFFYFAQLSEALFGFGITSIRLVSVLSALGVIYLLYAHRRWLGEQIWLAALIMAISPAFVFYSRSGIHESLFVFFQVMVFCGAIRWWQTSSRTSWNLIFAGLVGVVLVKETWVLAMAAAVLAVLVTLPRTLPTWKQKLKEVPLAKAGQDFFLWLLLLLFFCFEYTASADGLWRIITAFLPWAKTGLKSGHDKSVFYWLELMATFEWPLLFCMGSLFFLAIKRSTYQMGLAVFAVSLLLVYSLIPYKTPWCSISIFWPFAILLPAAMNSVSSQIQRASIGIVVVLSVVSMVHSYRLNFERYAADKEPYVYVQTTAEMGEFHKYLLNQNVKNPAKANAPIVFLLSDSWPIPYMFQRFTGIRYHLKGERPKLLLVDPKHRQKVRKDFPKYVQKKLRIRWAKDHSLLFYDPQYYNFEGVL